MIVGNEFGLRQQIADQGSLDRMTRFDIRPGFDIKGRGNEVKDRPFDIVLQSKLIDAIGEVDHPVRHRSWSKRQTELLGQVFRWVTSPNGVSRHPLGEVRLDHRHTSIAVIGRCTGTATHKPDIIACSKLSEFEPSRTSQRVTVSDVAPEMAVLSDSDSIANPDSTFSIDRDSATEPAVMTDDDVRSSIRPDSFVDRDVIAADEVL